jgi:glycosyltransferase involved in cell wall biosynthesis
MLTSDNEGTPVSLIEAAAAARPAVSTAAGGVQDVVVTERTGFVVPRGDVDALAGALARMADGDLRRRMGIAAREHVRARYGSARLLRDVEALYAELLERRRERGEVSPGRGTR